MPKVRELNTGRTIQVKAAGKSTYERDPITCPAPACGEIAEWRRTVYQCPEGHEWRPA